MATAANITVKKHDGTTDVTYVVVSGSPGDRMPAVFRQDAFAAVQGNRPVFTVQAKPTQNGQRVVEWKLVFPELVTDSTTGVTSVRVKNIHSGAFTLDSKSTDASIAECAAQSANLLKSTLMQSVLASGYSPV